MPVDMEDISKLNNSKLINKSIDAVDFVNRQRDRIKVCKELLDVKYYMENISISQDRIQHSIGVGKQAYNIAHNFGLKEDFCNVCKYIGATYDIGFEEGFSEDIRSMIMGCIKKIKSIQEVANIKCDTLTDDAMFAVGTIVVLANSNIDYNGEYVTLDEKVESAIKRNRDKEIISSMENNMLYYGVVCSVLGIYCNKSKDNIIKQEFLQKISNDRKIRGDINKK